VQERQEEHRTPEPPAHDPDTAPLFDAAYLHNPAPEYPAIALQRRWEGTVLLNVHVLANGSAREVTVIASSGHDSLDAAAMQAVADWHFVPAHRAGQAIDAWVKVPLIFKAA
jgi:protein TonB